MKSRIDLIYYVDVLSSWCLIAEDALARVQAEFGDDIRYQWRIAALRDALGYTPEQLQWYYSRTRSVTGVQLNASWLRSTADGSKWPDLAAEAARGLGCEDDRVRLALSRAAMIDGRRVCDRPEAVEVAAAASGLNAAAIDAAMSEPATAARIEAAKAEFVRIGATMRPTFVVRNAIGDCSMLSGCWRYEPLAAVLRAHIDDQRGYESFMSQTVVPAGVV